MNLGVLQYFGLSFVMGVLQFAGSVALLSLSWSACPGTAVSLWVDTAKF